jgi:isopentenyldiphosphate isomerase
MAATEEYFDVLDETGALTGVTAPRSRVHREGLFHRAVHSWLFVPTSGEVLLQRRAACKDSWPGAWDVSSAGHISAGGVSAAAAARELEEEIGLALPSERFEYALTHLERLASVQRGKPFTNNEFNDI